MNIIVAAFTVSEKSSNISIIIINGLVQCTEGKFNPHPATNFCKKKCLLVMSAAYIQA